MEDSDERTAARRRPVDRISSMTDDLLIHILSFLPTKFAAGTSVLSTRWKNLADKIVNIDLDDSLFLRRWPWVPPEKRSPSTKANFAFFVRKVLFSRVGSTIQSFRLCYGNTYDYHLFDKWILFVLMHNVREMHLDVKIDTSKSYPVEIFTSKTLEVLRLVAGFDLSLPIANFNLVNLKVLRLEFIIFNDDESVERVLSGCPVLHELCLKFCKMLGVNTLIKVCIPSLKNLSLFHCFGEYHVILDTPNLANLLYDTRGDLGFSIKNRTSIVNAEIGWGLIDKEHMEEIKKKEDLMSYGGRGMKVINFMNNVRSLCLQGPSLTALYYSESSLATFGNLTRLELSPSSLLRDWWALPDLLACCPNLEALVFFKGFIIPRDIGKEFGYCLPQSVPVCFTSSLKVIEIRAFYGQECELKIVEYFLAHVAFLRKMVIGTDVCGVSPFGSKREGGLMYHEEIPEWVLPTCKRLSETPRCLKTCQIVVSWTERLKKSMRILI